LKKDVTITVHVPRQMLNAIDNLVKEGYFICRSEAIRFAIANMLLDIARAKQAWELNQKLGI